MKEKLSITLDDNVISRVDAIIDGVNIKNRSQAMETLIRRGLNEKSVSTAVILAGGRESRLKFEDTYKPLVRIDGRPLILNTIERLKSAGIKNILIVAGPITERIFELVGDGSELGGVDITYIKDNSNGTSGAVAAAARHIKGPFFVVLGDEWFDFDLCKLIDLHCNNDVDATLAVSVTELSDSDDYIRIVGNKITEFQYHVKKRTHHVSAGVFLMEHNVLEKLPRSGSLERDVFPKIAREGRLGAFIFSGNWRHLK